MALLRGILNMSELTNRFVCNIVGARPNFMKVAPVVHALKDLGISQNLVHTGQHYDPSMSQVFFDELGLPQPDLHLGVGSETPSKQTARIMVLLEEAWQANRPSLVTVAGDVTSTVAASFTAARMQIPLAHIEAGLRSFDRSMPEELNRIVTDHLSDMLFTTEESANRNLAREAVDAGRVFFVGNCMVDSLFRHLEHALKGKPWDRFAVAPGAYALLTLHRPSNVDDIAILRELMGVISDIAGRIPVIFPVHPRTKRQLEQASEFLASGILLCEPLPYLEFLGLMAKARVVLTDSGGIQEETTALGVPCLTLRNNTERPVTIELGTNHLVGTRREAILEAFGKVVNGTPKAGKVPPLWDGQAGTRIAKHIAERLTMPRP